MRPSPVDALAVLLPPLLCLSACQSESKDTGSRSGLLQTDPIAAANDFFTSHYDFYYEDPARSKAVLAPRLFRILKHQYDAIESTGQIGALDCDPWTNAQDGEIVQPYHFTTLESGEAEAVVRLNYTFDFGPKSRRAQSVVLKLQRSSPRARWQVSDFIMPNNESLVALLERTP